MLVCEDARRKARSDREAVSVLGRKVRCRTCALILSDRYVPMLQLIPRYSSTHFRDRPKHFTSLDSILFSDLAVIPHLVRRSSWPQTQSVGAGVPVDRPAATAQTVKGSSDRSEAFSHIGMCRKASYMFFSLPSLGLYSRVFHLPVARIRFASENSLSNFFSYWTDSQT